MRYLFALAAMFLSVSTRAQEISKPRLAVLENGLRVVTVEDHKSPIVTAVWSAHVGDSAEPPDFGGNSHYLEHLLLFRGTEKYPGNAIGDRISGAGGYFNGHTWYDWTTFEITLPSDRLDDILDMHEQMMFHAAFAGADFETEKKAVFEELRSGQDKPYTYLWREASYHMYDGESYYSRDTIGTIEKVQAATVDRVRRYYRDYYVPNNMTLVLAGDLDTEEAMAKVRARFAKVKAGSVAAAPYKPLALKPGVTVVAQERAIGKSYFLAAFQGPQATSSDFAPYQVLISYLTDGKTAPLREELVERRKLFEEIEGEALPRRFPGGWQPITGEGGPGKTVEGLAALLDALAKLRGEGVPAERLELTKSRLISRHRVASEDLYDLARGLAQADAHGDYRIDAEFAERIARVTAEDVWVAAKKYLDPGHCFVMAIFPEGGVPEDFVERVRAAGARAAAMGSGGLIDVRLADGATLLYDARPGAPVESFSAAIGAGERHDGGRPGTAKAVAAMLRRLTARRSKAQLQEFLDKEGISLSGEVRKDGTIMTVTAPSGKTAALGSLLREITAEPSFAPQEWPLVRNELLAEITSALDRPQSVAFDALLGLVYPGTPYGAGLVSQKKSLESLGAGELAEFHRRFYRPERIAVAYSGPASRESVERALSGRFGAPGEAAAPPEARFAAASPEKTARAAVPMAGKKQVNLYWAWPGPPVDSDEWILWRLAQRAIGGDLAGRLWQLRQKEGLAYSVWFQDFQYRDRPLTGIYMATAKDKFAAACAALDREIARALEGLTAEELERVKISELAELERQDAVAETRSKRHARWRLAGMPLDYRARMRRIVSAARLEDVNRAVKATLSKERFFKAEAGALE